MARTNIPTPFGIARTRGQAELALSATSFEEIDDLIRAMKTGSREFNLVMDFAAQALARTTHAFVFKAYAGPRIRARSGGAGYERSTFGFPIRQITGKTARGWRVRRIAPGIWECFNEERGAYMVEYGIVRGGQSVARKPLKRSGIATLNFIQRTRFAQRIAADTFGNLRNNKGQFRSFQSRMRGSSLIGMAGPTGYLP